MRNPAGSLLFLASLCALAHPGVGFSQWSHTEDFATTAYRDSVETTADWNTADGELKFFPFDMGLAGGLATTGSTLDVEVHGDLLVMAEGNDGFRLVDVSDPAVPVPLGGFDTPGNAFAARMYGNRVVVADGHSGVEIFDVSDPSSPALVGGLDTAGIARRVWLEGTVAYVADGLAGLQVLDVSDPSAPVLIGNYDTVGQAYDVMVSGNTAYVADYDQGLLVLDVSDPASPSYLGALDPGGSAYRVFVAGRRAFVAAGLWGLRLIDVSDPAAPTLLGTYQSAGNVGDVIVEGNIAYLAHGPAGLRILDVSDPAAPVPLDLYDTPGDAVGLRVVGDLAYVADGTAGLQVVQASQFVRPAVVGAFEWGSEIEDVAIAGRYAYVAEYGGSMSVLDVSDPAAPAFAGLLSTGGNPLGIDVAGDHAYVASIGGMFVVDVTDPTAPDFVAVSGPPAYCYDLVAAGDHVYVAAGIFGLAVVDVSEPGFPTVVGSVPLTAEAYDVEVAGRYAFLTTAASAVEVVDVADPANPVVVGFVYGTGRRLDKWGDFVYVADGIGSLNVYDVSNPLYPSLAGSYDTSGQTEDVTVVGDRAYLVDSQQGLFVLDVSTPYYVTAEHIVPVADPVAVFPFGDHAFVSKSGLILSAFRTRQRDVDVTRNLGRSLVLGTTDYPVISAGLLATGTGDVGWEIRADGGAAWQPVPADDSRIQLELPGTGIEWRADLRWGAAAHPVVDRVTARWYAECGPITSIVDVPGDQGGRVYLSIHRSGYDHPSVTVDPVARYDVYRRVDDATLQAKVASLPEDPHRPDLVGGAVLPGIPARTLDGTTYVTGGMKAANGAFPEGTWAQVASVSATQTDTYVVEVPTAADSSSAGPHPSVFLVTTHTTTPSVWYVSHPDSGCSVDNIAPGVPQGLSAEYAPAGVALDWDDAPEADFQYHRIYRSIDPDFTPGRGDLVHETATSAWNDPVTGPWDLHYRVTTVDHAGNESGPAAPDGVSGASGGPPPVRTVLLDASPNPFNPATRIRYELGAEQEVHLRIYDVSGRMVRALVRGEIMPAGRHEAVWRGVDERGRAVASGVYLYRLDAGDFTRTKRMTLAR